MPVRLAKPYSGDAYGFHFPLIQGTEVAIAFEEGDPDRPYIAHALHDSRHVDHVTDKNGTRNVIRTPANNKLRMEDKRGEEHIKLSTEYGGKTQLNLGHNVDASRELRGEGAELRTDDWISIQEEKEYLSVQICSLRHKERCWIWMKLSANWSRHYLWPEVWRRPQLLQMLLREI